MVAPTDARDGPWTPFTTTSATADVCERSTSSTSSRASATAIVADTSLTGARVTRVLDQLGWKPALPPRLQDAARLDLRPTTVRHRPDDDRGERVRRHDVHARKVTLLLAAAEVLAVAGVGLRTQVASRRRRGGTAWSWSVRGTSMSARLARADVPLGARFAVRTRGGAPKHRDRGRAPTSRAVRRRRWAWSRPPRRSGRRRAFSTRR